MDQSRTIAYFSMEIALAPAIPTYSGGLGILAGDTLRAGADLGLPMIGVTLLHRAGYFSQTLSPEGRQSETPVAWDPAQQLRQTQASASVAIEGREVRLTAWRYDVRGQSAFNVPVFLIDADVEGNDPQDRKLTHYLYGGDHKYRLCQEIILGIGGIRILRSLGFAEFFRYHMNEGHSSLLTAELLREAAAEDNEPIDDPAIAAAVREQCVFTTHTPVAAGHDKFDLEMVRDVAGPSQVYERSQLFVKDGMLDTTHAAMNLSAFSNAVSKKHAEVAREMFPGRVIEPITNGVHPSTWVGAPIAKLLDGAAPGWRADGAKMRGAEGISLGDIRSAHAQARAEMLAAIEPVALGGPVKLDPAAFTIGCARRATPYKRLDLILSDLERLKRIAASVGPIQLVFAGKAHPRDGGGKDLLVHIAEAMRGLSADAQSKVRIAVVPGYDMTLAAKLVAGCDMWLNTPLRPLEASGTSGMKAAMNGVPSLSVPDGWWIEGCEEGVTGWSVDGVEAGSSDDQWKRDTASIYDKLEKLILPLYYGNPEGFAAVRRGAIARNGSVFNTHRMLKEYATKAYGIPLPA